MSDHVAEVESGKLRGVVLRGAHAFLGVPYGAPTGGRHRFLPPRPPAPWRATRDATGCRVKAPQLLPDLPLFPLLDPPDLAPSSEDCLTLNVWTPATDAGRRPVMVWFHGGAFQYGSSNHPRLQGMRLCRRDVVLVTVNQRLDVFGHLDLSEVGGEAFAHSANAGTLDMVAALEWVQTNIAVFGGDPGNVTIFGQSGGGSKVSTLMAMPKARGLFHRAVVQSGAMVRAREVDRSLEVTDAVLRELGLPARGAVSRLQAMSIDDLLAAADRAGRLVGPSPWPVFDRYLWCPTLDGEVVPRHPFHPDASPVSADVPLVIGDTKDEATMLMRDDEIWDDRLTEDELLARVQGLAGTYAGEVVETYRRTFPGTSPARRMIAIATDVLFRHRSSIVVEHRLHQGRLQPDSAPTWRYSFDWESPLMDGRLRATHTLDVPFVFDTLEFANVTDLSDDAFGLAATMADTWTSFARSGDPNHGGLPHWPAYDDGRRSEMVFDVPCRVEHDHLPELRQLWNTVADPGRTGGSTRPVRS